MIRERAPRVLAFYVVMLTVMVAALAIASIITSLWGSGLWPTLFTGIAGLAGSTLILGLDLDLRVKKRME